MFGFIKQVFITLLTVWTKVSVGESLTSNSEGHTKCVSLKNRLCQTRPTLANIKLFLIHLLPVLIYIVEVVMILMMLEYVFRIKQRL